MGDAGRDLETVWKVKGSIGEGGGRVAVYAARRSDSKWYVFGGAKVVG